MERRAAAVRDAAHAIVERGNAAMSTAIGKQTRTSKSGTIIWAVDPSPGDAALQRRTLKAITAVWHGDDVSIEPVCVMSGDWRGAGHRLAAQQALERLIADARESNVTALTMLEQERHSLSGSVDTLLRHARDTGARVIAVGTHARTRLARLALGSFAETLLLRSNIPMLVVNPSAARAPTGPPRRLLFPTDFSAGSRRAFLSMLPLARRNSARVTLFYQFEYLSPETSGRIHASAIHQQFFTKDLAARRKKAESWARLAARAGVTVDVAISQEPGFVPDAILAKAASTRAGLIAMASQSGVVAAPPCSAAWCGGSCVRRGARSG